MKWLRIIVTAYVTAAAVAYVVESSSLWGLDHLKLISPWFSWILICAALIVLWFPLRSRARFTEGNEDSAEGLGNYTLFAIIPAVAVLLFILARSHNLMLGDSFRLLPALAEPMLIAPTEQLTLIFARLLFKLMGSAELAYQMMAIVSGAVFIAVIAFHASYLTPVRTRQLSVILIFVGLAQIQLFFGYVENYAVATALLTLFLYFGYRAVDDRRYLWFAVTAYIAAAAFHLISGFLLPGLIYILWLRFRIDGNRLYAVVAGILLTITVLGSIAYLSGFQEESIFNPLVDAEANPYTLFSVQHLTDVANLVALIAPLPVLFLAIDLAVSGFRTFRSDRRTVFLSVCTMGGFALLFFVDPKLGAIRDWDLLSLYGIPLAFLVTIRMTRDASWRSRSGSILRAALAVILIHTVPWIASNANPERSQRHLKEVIADDMHYSPDYYKGDRLMSWGIMLADLLGDVIEAERSFRLRLEADPSDRRSWLYYARACTDLDKDESAIHALRNVRTPEGLNKGQLKLLAKLSLHHGDTVMASSTLRHASYHHPRDFDFLFLIGVLNSLEGKHRTAMKFFQQAALFDPTDPELLLQYAQAAIAARQPSTADSLIREARAISGLSPRQLDRLREIEDILFRISDF